MSNMGYCRFENTYNDLLDCYESMDVSEEKLNPSEEKYRQKIINLCKDIVGDFAEEESPE